MLILGLLTKIYVFFTRNERESRRPRGGEETTAADRVERRLQEIERDMLKERDATVRLAQDVAQDVMRASQNKYVTATSIICISLPMVQK